MSWIIKIFIDQCEMRKDWVEIYYKADLFAIVINIKEFICVSDEGVRM